MAVYAYRASDEHRAQISGSVAADTPRSARDLLRTRGLRITALHEQKAGARSRRWPPRHRSGNQKLTSFIRELATLLSVGVPLLDALDAIMRQHRGRFRERLLMVREAVAAGTSLSDAMRQDPDLFDELCVHITQVGEDAGTLDSALERLGAFKDRSRLLKGRLATALIYPAIVVVMAVFVGTFLMTSVVPSILGPLVEMGRPLPLPTRIVKTASDGLVAWGWLAALLLLVLAASLAAALRTTRGRHLWHSTLLRLPLVGDLLRKQAVVRICVIMEALLGSGVVFIRALQVAQRATSNVVLRKAMERWEMSITAGGDVGTELEKTGAFSPLVTQVFSVGQQSGQMEQVLARLGSDYDREVAAAAQRLGAVLEPLLIVVLALLVLLIAMATMLPILEAGDVLH